MADEKKRIIDLSELSQEVQVGQYILVDSASGTGKMNLKKIVDDSTTSLAERVTDLETGLTEEENARIAADTELSGNVSNLQTALETKADNNGYYPDLYAGNLSSTRKQTDSTPYIMRKTGGDLSRIGEREDDTLVGATVDVNQMVNPPASGTTTKAGITYTYDGNGRTTCSGTFTTDAWSYGAVTQTNFTFIKSHKYFLRGCPIDGNESYLRVWVNSVSAFPIGHRLFDDGKGKIIDALADETNVSSNVMINYTYTGDITKLVFIPQLFDLTAMLGSTIADYLYTLESATAGAGIAKLREWGFLTDEYIPYNEGSLESVEATAHKMVGFNQWDEVTEDGTWNNSTGAPVDNENRRRNKNPIAVLPNTAYYTNKALYRYFYDADMNFILYDNSGANTFTTPTNARFMNVQQVKTDWDGTETSINLSSDRNGEYEPYSAHTYDLGTDTLRGLFKLDSNNNLYADGDTKTSDGTVTRKYGTRAYQSGDESLADAITDGTNTVYKLTTPTTEQSTPFTNPQICDPDGTEEYVTSNGVPVGHVTEYDYDIKGLAEELIDVPDVPSSNGTYVLKATRTADGLTYNWVTG